MNRLKLIHALVLRGTSLAAFLLVGCGTLGGPEASAARDRQEMAKLRNRQETSLSGPGPTKIGGEAGKVFVGNRRCMIIPGSNVAESDSNRILSIDLTQFGTATALTGDGYFLTAAHVVAEGPPVALNKMDSRQARIVKVFPKSDLALIKFPFKLKVNRYFKNLAPGIEEGSYVFSDAAKGTVEQDGVSPWKNGIRSIECELPSVPGQSGGPVANAEGELVGIIVGVYQNRFSKRYSTTSVVEMVQPQIIRQLIESDRLQ